MEFLSLDVISIYSTLSPLACIVMSILAMAYLVYLLVQIIKMKKYKQARNRLHLDIEALSVHIYNLSEEFNLLYAQIQPDNAEKRLNNDNAEDIAKVASQMQWQQLHNNANRSTIEYIAAKYPQLSHQEIEHFLLRHNGFSDKDIAQILGISLRKLPISWYQTSRKMEPETIILDRNSIHHN